MKGKLLRLTQYLISMIFVFCISGFIDSHAQHIQFSDDFSYGEPCKLPQIHRQIHYNPQTDTVILPSLYQGPFSQLENFSSPNFGSVPSKLLEVTRTSFRLEKYFGPHLKTSFPNSCPRPIPAPLDIDFPSPCSLGYIEALAACLEDANLITGEKNTQRECESRSSIGIELGKSVRCMENSLSLGNRYSNVIRVFTFRSGTTP